MWARERDSQSQSRLTKPIGAAQRVAQWGIFAHPADRFREKALRPRRNDKDAAHKRRSGLEIVRHGGPRPGGLIPQTWRDTRVSDIPADPVWLTSPGNVRPMTTRPR